jgi:uncharacterized protein
MSKEIAFKAIEWLFTNALLADENERQVEISFWGGEPLLKWDLLKDITLYAEDMSKRTAIPIQFGGTTNGTLLVPERFSFLDEHKIFFMISFDGTKETHDYHRKTKQGFGSHAIVEKNLKQILNKWPFYRVRMSPFAERIDHFYEDCKYIFDLGCNYLMFSPVYESNWTEEKWNIWENQCKQVVDYMAELKLKGRKVEIEHFKSYIGPDNSRWPCGSGRNYCHINHEGYIFSCHRAEKFNDNRPFIEQELCLGHIDQGITKPEIREKFINFEPECKGKGCWGTSPCWGGCYMVNWDFNKDITKPYFQVCRYVEMQKRVSQYYKERMVENTKDVSCMPYQGERFSCDCYNANYTGPTNHPQITVETLALLVSDLNNRIAVLEKKIK